MKRIVVLIAAALVSITTWAKNSVIIEGGVYLLNNIKVQSPKVDNVGSNGIVIFRNKNYQKK